MKHTGSKKERCSFSSNRKPVATRSRKKREHTLVKMSHFHTSISFRPAEERRHFPSISLMMRIRRTKKDHKTGHGTYKNKFNKYFLFQHIIINIKTTKLDISPCFPACPHKAGQFWSSTALRVAPSGRLPVCSPQAPVYNSLQYPVFRLFLLYGAELCTSRQRQNKS